MAKKWDREFEDNIKLSRSMRTTEYSLDLESGGDASDYIMQWLDLYADNEVKIRIKCRKGAILIERVKK